MAAKLHGTAWIGKPRKRFVALKLLQSANLGGKGICKEKCFSGFHFVAMSFKYG